MTWFAPEVMAADDELAGAPCPAGDGRVEAGQWSSTLRELGGRLTVWHDDCAETLVPSYNSSAVA